jgi:hypothetical protein
VASARVQAAIVTLLEPLSCVHLSKIGCQPGKRPEMNIVSEKDRENCTIRRAI